MLNNSDLAYIAGFFDAEGAIMVKCFKTKTNLRYQLAVSLADVDRNLLVYIRRKFRNFGSIAMLYRVRYFGQKPTYEWRLESKQAMFFLKQVYPFLMIKKSEAETGIRFQSFLYRTGGKFLSEQELEERQNTREYMRYLHKNRKIEINKKPRKLILAYLAGLFDGDGHITVLHKSTLTTVLTSNERPMLEYLLEYFNMGFIYQNAAATSWIVSSHDAKDLLHYLLPFLKLKNKEAELAIKFQDSIDPKNSRPISTEEQLYLDKLIHNIKSRHLTKGVAIRRITNVVNP